MRRISREGNSTARQTSGFTLIELVIVMGILVMVLSATYRLVLDCLDAERTIDKLTIPEKVGEGILTLFRSDLSGTIWRHSGKRVFFVIDNGSQKDARDEIRFLSTVEPTPVEDATQGSTVQVASIRTITGIAYFLKPNQGVDGVAANTLFRKEIVDFTDENPLEAPGTNYEVFDKVAYFSVECFDSFDSTWVPVWDSEAMIDDEEAALEAEEQAGSGIARVGERDAAQRQTGAAATGAGAKTGDAARTKVGAAAGSRRSASREQNALTQSAPGADPTLTEGQKTEMLPPAAVPTAVRVELGIYAGQGNKIERDAQGMPIVKTYATIVPILTSQRVRIESDESEEGDLAGGGVGGATDPEGLNGVTQNGQAGGQAGPRTPGGAGKPGGAPGGARGGAGRGGRATSKAPGTPGAAGAQMPKLPGMPGGAR